MSVQGKRNAAYACQLATNAVQRLFNAAGGRALYLDSVLQRQFRDCFAAAAIIPSCGTGRLRNTGSMFGLHR